VRKTFFCGAAVAAMTLATGPVLAQTAPSAISQADKQTGAKAHPEILNEFGGAYDSPKQADYVRRVGQKVAVQSGLSNTQSDFTITLLNSSVNNAFAIPGGYVYVTRQLMGLMNDEAELASVLGHETGHVAARHSQRRQNAATRNQVLGTLGQVLTGVLLGSNSQVGQLLNQGISGATQYFTLKFSRSQEYEADDLGVNYLFKAGYDPMASSTMLASLAAQSALDARVRNQDGRSVPEWASTHPDPGSRVTRAAQKAAATGAKNGVRNRDAFLAALDGALYDDDPKQGVIDGQVFKHPELKLTFTIPDGYAMSNGSQAVTISGNGGQAQFTGAGFDGDLNRYVVSAFSALTGGKSTIDPAKVTTRQVNGLNAATATAAANTQSGQVDVTIFAYAFDAKSAYHFVTIVPAGSGIGPFSSMVQSMRRMTVAEAAAVKPRKIQVVTVKSGDTVASLAGRMAYSSYQTERFLTLNALTAGTALRPGQKVKLVVY
jgi:predicted Zn-dependent protease